MFREKENNLNESKSAAENNCRQALANAGYAFGFPQSFHWSQLNNPNGDKKAAIEAYNNLLSIEKSNKSALEGLAFLYQFMGNMSEAQGYRKKLKQVEVEEYGIDFENATEVVDYLLAKTGEAEKPARVPEAFVSAHFDKYSEIFDTSLSDQLQYTGPQVIQKEIEKFAKTNENNLNILDLGCGTGLVGQAVHQYAKNLTGVDLSEKMIEKAEACNCYSTLVKSDISTFLQKEKSKFDIISAGDVFNYFGDMKPIFKEIKSALATDGLFIFTIETSEKIDYKLCNTGRFQHHPDYIRMLSSEFNFKILNEEAIVLRKERNTPVNAHIYCLA